MTLRDSLQLFFYMSKNGTFRGFSTKIFNFDLCIYAYVFVCVCDFMRTCVRICVYICMCVYVYIYVCVCVCMYVYV